MYVKKKKTLTGILLQRPQQVLESISKTGTIWIIIIFSRNVSIQLPERPPLPFKAALVHQSSHQSNILRGENVFSGQIKPKKTTHHNCPWTCQVANPLDEVTCLTNWTTAPKEVTLRNTYKYQKNWKTLQTSKKSDKTPTNTIKISKTHKNQKFLFCPENQVKAKCRRQVFNIKFEKMHFQWKVFKVK